MWKVYVGNLLLIDAICIQRSEGGGSLCPPQEIDVKTFWIPHPLISRLDSSSYSVLRYNYKQFLNRNCIVCLTTVSVYHLLNLLIVSNFLAILIESGLPKKRGKWKKSYLSNWKIAEASGDVLSYSSRWSLSYILGPPCWSSLYCICIPNCKQTKKSLLCYHFWFNASFIQQEVATGWYLA